MQIPDRIEEKKIIMREATQIENANIRIEELKFNLSKTDYQAIKFAEGELTAEEYAETKQKRHAWREEINALENKLKNL